MHKTRIAQATAAAALAGLAPAPLVAQEAEEEPRRTRIGLGVQVVPSYPGSDTLSVRPLFDIARARGEDLYEFEAPDESFGFALVRSGGFAAGPTAGFEGERDAEDAGTALPKVGFTVEVGGFAQYTFSDSLRARLEVRKGIGGHKGLIGNLGVDYIARDGDDWLLSAGPRLTFADDRYHAAYFSVAPQDAAPSGLPAYSAGGGLQAAGATVGYIRQLTPRWGLYSYAKYDRLVGDPADSPITRRFGSRDQLSGGLAVTYTFGGRD
jgi:MipA family protein